MTTQVDKDKLYELGFRRGGSVRYYSFVNKGESYRWVDYSSLEDGWLAGCGFYKTPFFPDAWTAYVYATADNWGQ